MTRLPEFIFGCVILSGLGVCAHAQMIDESESSVDAIIDVPGFRPLRLGELSPEVRARVGLPGVQYDEMQQTTGGLDPLPDTKSPEVPAVVSPPNLMSNSLDPQGVEGDAGTANGEESEAAELIGNGLNPREETIKRMSTERAYPHGRVPDDVYLKAWEHIQKMPIAEPPEEPTDSKAEQDSWLAPARRLFGSLWRRIPRALAQSTQWTQIGPAPLALPNGLKNAGIVEDVVVDPSNLQTLYFGTYGGGVWKTIDGGGSWAPKTDDQPSLQMDFLAIHPTNSSLVLAGTGQFDNKTDPNGALEKGFGVIRSTDAGTTWSQIGPTCTTADAACQIGGLCAQTDPLQCPNSTASKSKLVIQSIVFDRSTGPTRVWAATSKGLWWSEDAANPAVQPSQVRWYRVTSLPNSVDGPDRLNRVFLSSWNTISTACVQSGQCVLYASVRDSLVAGHNGWYRSANRGASWTQINSGLPLTPSPQQPVIERAAIAESPNPPNIPLTDVLYTLVSTASDALCGGPATRLYKAIVSNSSPTWNLVTAAKTCPIPGGAGCCTVAADCCDDGACYCNAGVCSVYSNINTIADCEGLRSVRVHPTDANVVLLGGVRLYRSTTAGTSIDYSFKAVGLNTLHPDHWALTFNPSSNPTTANGFYAGGDGGIWSTSNVRDTPVAWSNRNSGLANLEFYRGSVDPSNYGASAGGTQDNGYLRGGTATTWSVMIGSTNISAATDGYSVLINPYNSNDMYVDGYSGVFFVGRSTDGGGTAIGTANGLPTDPQGRYDIIQESLTADYRDCSATACRSLLIYSNRGQQPYRSTDAGTSWQSIAGSLLPQMKSFAVAPSASLPSNLIFGAACDLAPNNFGVWRTSNASSWSRFTDNLPNRCLTSVVIDTSKPCDATSCTLYVAASGFDEDPATPRHVFQSVDSGQHWTNITGTGSTALPNIPVNKVIMHPTNPNILYVASDMGVYQGTFAGGAWSWAVFLTGLPKAVVVTDLTAHADSGILRAWTYGRSVWEAKAFTPVSSDAKVNTSSPTNEAKAPRMSSTSGGEQYAVTWADDRSGANNWHVRYQTYNASATPLQLLDLPVDDGTNHVAQYPTVAAHPTSLLSQQCSWEAWQDDRLDRVNHINHIFYNYVCGNGYRYFPTSDMQADTQIAGLNAQFPSLTWLPAVPLNAFFAVAWQADRSAPNGFQDVYLRFFSPLGPRNGVPTIRVNSTNSEGRAPAVASDANDNVYIVWQSGSSQYLRIAKYDSNGVKIQPGPALDGNGIATGSDVSIAVVNGNPPTVIATYWATGGNGLPTVFRTRLRGDVLSIIATEQVDQPPAVPAGAQQAWQPSVAVDGSNQGVISWHSNVNAADGSSLSAFARSFDSSGAWVKNDFRVDFSGSAKVDSVRVARTSVPKQFAYSWRDNRSGRYEIYTRVVPSLP